MNKKRIFKIGIIGLFILLIIYVAVFFEPMKVTNVRLSFDVKLNGDDNNIVQIFYIEENMDEFSPECVETYVLESGEEKKVSFDIKDNIKIFRIDVGSMEEICTIENMRFSMGIFEIKWTEEDWNTALIINGIDTYRINGESVEIVPNSEDPFIAWEVQALGVDEKFEQLIYLSNLCIRLFTMVVLALILSVLVNKFEFFVEFPTEIWRSRGVLLQLAKNDFKTRFAGSYLGIFWAFVQPVVTVLVYWFVFEKGLRSGAVLNVPFVLWLIAGIIPWFFFSDALSAGTNALIEYQYLVKKVVFQISVLPLVKVISNFFVHIAFIIFAIILFASYGYYPDLFYLQIIYYSLCTFVLVLGICYATSALVGFFRDLSQIIGIVLQVGVWMTPIMWNMETMNVPEGLKLILKANPMYYIVSGYRDTFINKVWFWQNMGLTVYFWVFAIIILGGGMIIFKRLKPHFADVL